ncbi:DNA polymerase III subunit beta [Catenisphaera adipataccumulans]|uniref:Beta sliding clamp n=1 Tax=Catenisphaera adipataccumulans TaxID=700500 RepID=A0A7W8CYD9_9FIRM|nr:DNA polymerase III subunit beta [Catenisphaera adipataccumulans]MBB5183846.1 DNA polymerase-3 subunit beta [Catenisphaera adipataccumulans]
MKFSINRRFFFNKINMVSRAISVFSPLPALSGIWMDVRKDSIVLTGSDSNITIQTTIYKGEMNNLEIESTGSIVIESKYLSEIVRKLDSEFIDVELIDYTLVQISSPNGKFNLNGIQASEYPEINLERPENHFVLNRDDLTAIVNQTVFACGNDDQRPVLKGVNFHAKGKTLYCSGSDSFRLAYKKIELNEPQDFNITIPTKSLIEVQRSIDETIDAVDVYADTKKIQFIFDKTIFQSRLIDGNYPIVERIIPNQFIAEMRVDTQELAGVIDRTAFIRTDKIHVIKMECSEMVTRIKTASTEIGNSDEVLTDCVYHGDDLRFSCNGTFVTDALKALGGEKVRLQFSANQGPILISNPDDTSTLMIIVPMRSHD